MTACGPDDPVWSVTAVTDRVTVRGNNTDSVQIQISVLDDERNAAPVGSDVTIQCIDPNGQPFGTLNGNEGALVRLLTDDLGIVGTSYRCNNETDETISVVCVVRYPAESASDNLVIQCTPATPANP